MRRRFAAIIAVLGVAAYGVHAYLNTPIEAYPDVTNVQVVVISQLPGLAPEEIERQLTVPLERVLNGVPGAISLRSESLFGLSLVFLTFDDHADAFRSRVLVSEQINVATLPDGAAVKLAPNATPLGEVMRYRLSSDRHDLYELRSVQEWTISKMLNQVPGVADVVSAGGFLKEMHVEVDPQRLVAHDMTLAQVSDALERSNVNTGGGFLRLGDQELMIRGIGLAATPEDITNVVLRSQRGTPVIVGDVARVIQSHAPRRGTVGLNHELDIVEGFVLLRRGENPADVLSALHDMFDDLNTRILPEGMSVEPFYDRTKLIEQTLKTVHTNLIEGFLLIVGVVWLFLRTVRGSFIVASVIPLSLLTAFIGLYLLGMPANLISMGAIDFGILVDGAVVLIEHVVHDIQLQKPSSRSQMLRLIARSALTVARPTFYAMAIIIAALLPVFTLERVEGRIFRPLALTYTFALIGALILAITLVPALCASLFRDNLAKIREPRFLERLREMYGRSVEWTLHRRALVLWSATAVLVFAFFVGTKLGTEFLPQLDEGDAVVFVEMPASISLQEAQKILLEVRRRILEFPEVSGTMSEHGRPEDGTDNEGVNMSETFVQLKSKSEWRAGWDNARLINAMRASLEEIPGVRYNFSQPIKDTVEESVSGVRGQVVLKIFGLEFEQMKTTLERARVALSTVPGIVDLGLYRETTVPQLQIKFDRRSLARSGVAVEDAQRTLETAFAGRIVTNIWEGERIVPVRVRLPREEKLDVHRIASILIPTPSGARVPLRDLASIEVRQGRMSITREENSRNLALKFNVDGRDLGSAIRAAREAVDAAVTVPEGYFLQWSGEFENQQRAIARLRVIVPVSLLVVFGLLYSALGSGSSAIAVLLIAPFAMTGGVFALYLQGVVLSVSAVIGFIALLGQISLAGLLVLSAIDDQRRQGTDFIAAIVAGALLRFRAVLMTSILAMLGLVPMAFSTGVGSETQQPFALAIVGGMVTTLLTALFVLPSLYSLLAPAHLGEVKEETDPFAEPEVSR